MICRVCKKELKDGDGRYMDYILLRREGIDNPICIKCAGKSPDAHFLDFKMEYL